MQKMSKEFEKCFVVVIEFNWPWLVQYIQYKHTSPYAHRIHKKLIIDAIHLCVPIILLTFLWSECIAYSICYCNWPNNANSSHTQHTCRQTHERKYTRFIPCNESAKQQCLIQFTLCVKKWTDEKKVKTNKKWCANESWE